MRSRKDLIEIKKEGWLRSVDEVLDALFIQGLEQGGLDRLAQLTSRVFTAIL